VLLWLVVLIVTVFFRLGGMVFSLQHDGWPWNPSLLGYPSPPEGIPTIPPRPYHTKPLLHRFCPSCRGWTWSQPGVPHWHFLIAHS
jgi:hypothetical protein